jgi:hypothetical protein
MFIMCILDCIVQFYLIVAQLTFPGIRLLTLYTLVKSFTKLKQLFTNLLTINKLNYGKFKK